MTDKSHKMPGNPFFFNFISLSAFWHSAKFMTQIDKQPEMIPSNPGSASSSLP